MNNDFLIYVFNDVEYFLEENLIKDPFTKFHILSNREFTVSISLTREVDCFYDSGILFIYYDDGRVKSLDMSSNNIHNEVYEEISNYLFR